MFWSLLWSNSVQKHSNVKSICIIRWIGNINNKLASWGLLFEDLCQFGHFPSHQRDFSSRPFYLCCPGKQLFLSFLRDLHFVNFWNRRLVMTIILKNSFSLGIFRSQTTPFVPGFRFPFFFEAFTGSIRYSLTNTSKNENENETWPSGKALARCVEGPEFDSRHGLFLFAFFLFFSSSFFLFLFV